MLLFRVSGVPVLLAGSWWIGSLLIVALYTPLVTRMLPDAGLGLSAVLAGGFAAAVGLSVLAPELGHRLVALRFGMAVRRVRLFLLGGLAEPVRSPGRPHQEGVAA